MIRLISFLLVFVSTSALSLTKPSVDLLTKPTLLLSQGRLLQASENFHYQSSLVLSQEAKFGTAAMWQTAGLAEGLAAMAAEKNNDAIAYEYWSNSVRYFLMGGSSWEKLQSEVYREFNQANNHLQVSMQQGGGGATLDDVWLQKLSIVEVWEDKLGYFSYKAPSPGLVINARQKPVENAPLENKNTQYKSHNPQSKLVISPSYSATPTFVPKPVPPINNSESTSVENAVDAITPSKVVVDAAELKANSLDSDINAGKSVSQSGADNVTEVQPLKFEQTTLQEMETSSKVITGEESSSAPQDDSEDGVTQPSKHVHRGNLEAGNAKGVSAVQRRSFAPKPAD